MTTHPRRPGGYLDAVQVFLAPKGLGLLKVQLKEGKLSLPMGTARPLCLLTGKSPRGAHSHAVVARVAVDGAGFDLTHDPHPDGGGIVGDGNWAGFLVALEPAAGAPAAAAAAAPAAASGWLTLGTLLFLGYTMLPRGYTSR